jgi:hypothetical protein
MLKDMNIISQNNSVIVNDFTHIARSSRYYIQILFLSHRQQSLHCKGQLVNAVCFENHKKCINILCGQIPELFPATAGRTMSLDSALKS